MVKFHRGERRYQRTRLIKRFLKEFLNFSWYQDPENALRRARDRVSTRKDCRCHYCVNQRAVYGNSQLALTRREVYEYARLRDDVMDAEDSFPCLKECVKLNPRLRKSVPYKPGWRYGRIYSNYSTKPPLPSKP